MPPQTHAERVAATEAFVRASIAHHDASHDWWHVHRVRAAAARLAADEGLPPADRQLAELAALVHDVADHKYCDDLAQARARLQRFLDGELGLGDEECGLVLHVVDGLGFKQELARQGVEQQQQQQQPDTEQQQQGARRAALLAVVQDADRLDAIGAIGIARCLTFGGARRHVLHDPAVQPRCQLSAEQYGDQRVQQTTINHFHEKLFKLKDLMRTAAGRAVAEERHAFMRQFLERFEREWEGAA